MTTTECRACGASGSDAEREPLGPVAALVWCVACGARVCSGCAAPDALACRACDAATWERASVRAERESARLAGVPLVVADGVRAALGVAR